MLVRGFLFDYLIEAPNWAPDSKRFAFVTYRIRES